MYLEKNSRYGKGVNRISLIMNQSKTPEPGGIPPFVKYGYHRITSAMNAFFILTPL